MQLDPVVFPAEGNHATASELEQNIDQIGAMESRFLEYDNVLLEIMSGIGEGNKETVDRLSDRAWLTTVPGREAPARGAGTARLVGTHRILLLPREQDDGCRTGCVTRTSRCT